MKKLSFSLLAMIAIFAATAQHRSTFDDLGLLPDSYQNGSNLSGGFLDGDAYFVNTYDTALGGSWSGFAYSDVPVSVDTITTGSDDAHYTYASASGGGVFGSQAFGICHTGSTPIGRLEGFAPGHEVYGFYVNNSAYDFLSMKYGDSIAKKFGGPTGTDSDWFRLTVTGWYQGAPILDSVTFYLADFRSPDTTQHYIVHSWQFVDLLTLGNVDSLTFLLSSSDTAGGMEMRTPAYFDMDNFMTTDGVPYTNPLAVSDSFSLVYMDTLTGNADTLIANILANDSVSPFLTNTVSITGGPDIIGATAYLDSNNNLVYVPAAGIAATDTITYTVCDQFDSCSSAQVYIYVTGPLNTGNGIMAIGSGLLYMYPNPAISSISIRYTSVVESVSLIDISGREVMLQQINADAANLNIAALSPGIYTVMIHTIDGTGVSRLVKQ
jgi:hypothetical protein